VVNTLLINRLLFDFLIELTMIRGLRRGLNLINVLSVINGFRLISGFRLIYGLRMRRGILIIQLIRCLIRLEQMIWMRYILKGLNTRFILWRQFIKLVDVEKCFYS
jgi:hypothetical protein